VTATEQLKWKGYTALVVGCALAIAILRTWLVFAEGAARGAFPDIWSGIAQLWRIALAGYLGMIAYKHLGPPATGDVRWRRAGWGRIVLGAMLLFSIVQRRFYPKPPGRYDFTPSNDSQAAGMELAQSILIPGMGLLLLVWGLSLVIRRNGKSGSSES